MATPVLQFDESVGATVRSTVREVLKELDFPKGSFDIGVLSGGANNVNLALRAGERAWALKLRDPIGTRFGVNPEAAIRCQMAAAAAGVAPTIRAHTLPAGHFVSDFVLGETLSPGSIRQQRLAVDIVRALHRLHEVRGSFRAFSIFDDIRTFLQGAREVGSPEPPDLAELLSVSKRMEEAFVKIPAPRALCHNDLVPQNLMHTGQEILLVDFDYAGDAWVATDLACVTSQAQMTREETAEFLSLYDPGADAGQRARVEILRFCNALREVAWALFAEPVLAHKTTLFDGWSYREHARMNLDLAGAILEECSAESLIASAVNVRSSALF